MLSGFKHRLHQDLEGEMAGIGIPSFTKSVRMGQTPSVPFLSQWLLGHTDISTDRGKLSHSERLVPTNSKSSWLVS